MSTQHSRACKHQVTLDVSIVQAVETCDKLPPFYETVRNGKRKRVYESVQPQHHFHVEYQLLPSEDAPKVYKTDVVTFGVVAKVHTEIDQRVVNVWNENGLTYYGWRHRHTFQVTKDSLLRLHSHKMFVRVWNKQDKLSVRARFDRPKAFRLSSPNQQKHGGEEKNDAEDGDGVFGGVQRPEKLPVVLQEVGTFNKRMSRQFTELEESIDVSLQNVSLKQAVSMDENERGLKGRKKVGKGGGEKSPRKTIAAASNASNADVLSLSDPGKAISTTMAMLGEDLSLSVSSALKGLTRRKMKQMQADSNEQARVEREGMTVLEIKMADLFAVRGEKISVKMNKEASNLKDFNVFVSLENKLMSEELSRALNPMTITVHKATNLPPLSYNEMATKVEGTFVRYRFPFKQSIETTRLAPNNSSVTWEESSTILLGTIPSELLLEALRGPPLLLELHDRDEKKKSEEQEQAMFGTNKGDELLGNCAYTKEMKNIPCTRTQALPLCGIAKVDLSELLDGLTMAELSLPVLSGSHLNTNDGLVLVGGYLHHHTQLAVTLQVSHPLLFTRLSASPTSRPLCPFGRIVYVLQCDALTDRILALANTISAAALNLNELEPVTLGRTLSTYKLTREQMGSRECNVITGFHFEDSSHQHILMLEGLREEGVHRLWTELPHHHTQDPGVVKVFYNSEFSFSRRQYGELDVDLTHIIFPLPLEDIVKQSGIYIRGSLPPACFQGVMTLHELKYATGIADLCRRSLFPTVEMVFSLSLQCSSLTATPITSAEHDASTGAIKMVSSTGMEKKLKRRRTWQPLDNHNSAYQELLLARKSLSATDHIEQNIAMVKTASDQVKSGREPRRQRAWTLGENEMIHNYSSQTYNSVELSKARLRECMNPTRRYTYCQQLHNMTLEPVDAEKVEKERKMNQKRLWLTQRGFVYPGVKSSRECNVYPVQPDDYRLEQLKESFQDNILHANTLKPTVSWLEFSWDDRKADFQRYQCPPLYFSPVPPISIHLAGQSKDNEKAEFDRKEKEMWRSKVVVDDTNFSVVRQGTHTELKGQACCQTDKLKSILKQQPNKLGLAPTEKLRVDKIPALAIISGSDEKELSRKVIGFIPGPLTHRSLQLDCNTVPIHKEELTSQSREDSLGPRVSPTKS